MQLGLNPKGTATRTVMGPDTSASDGASRTNTSGQTQHYAINSIELRARELIVQCARLTEAMNRISARIAESDKQASSETSGLMLPGRHEQPQASRPTHSA